MPDVRVQQYWTTVSGCFTVCLFFGRQMSLSVDSLYNAIMYELSEVFYGCCTPSCTSSQVFYEMQELHVIVYELS